MSKSNSSKSSLQNLHEAWASPFVAREKVSLFSGGILTARTMANLDSRGLGVEDRFRVGRKVVYPKKSLIEFLENRYESI